MVDAVLAGVLVTAVAFTTALVLRHDASDVYMRRHRDSMVDIARIAASMIDPSTLDSSAEADTETIARVAAWDSSLRRVRDSVPGVTQLFILQYDGKSLRRVAGSSNSVAFESPRALGALPTRAGTAPTPSADSTSKGALQAATDGATVITDDSFTGPLGEYQSLWEPIRNNRGLVVGVVALDMLTARYQQSIAQIQGATDRGFAIACVAGIGAFLGVYVLRRKAAVADLVIRDSEARFREIADAAPVMLWMSDADGNRSFFSRPWSEFTGIPADTLAKDGWHDTVHPRDLDALNLAVTDAIRDRRDFQTEYRLRRADGEFRWIADRGVPRFSPTGDILGFIGGSMDVTERKGAEQALEHAALIDRLTGMPNRVLLFDRLQQAITRFRRRPNRHYAVIFLDFDRFKFVNDTLGHDSGDEMLRQIGRRLRAVVRVTDSVARDAAGHTAARFGGDEFVIVLEDLAQPEDALAIADRLLVALAEPFELAGRKITSTASLGIVHGADSYGSPHDLLRDADTAMYEAKAAGKARYVVFDRTMRQRVERRLRLEQDLASAVRNHELVLQYQPVIDLQSGEMVSVEALIRWHHPLFGVVPPSEFIGVAEEVGLIESLGEWVFEDACAQIHRWKELAIADRVGVVAINLSRKQLSKHDLCDRLLHIAARHDVAPKSICLEITETSIMSDVKTSLAQLHSLKAAGFKLSLDDFGSGHSSLSNIHEFPIDTIKIDRTFIANMLRGRAHTALIQAVSTLAHNLNIRVVAEGVESAEQVPLLQSLDCDLAQGWFFCPPVRASEITDRCTDTKAKAA